jgi:DNA helicase-2/ATP-dependent DNA helicase PcrA
VEQAAVTIVCRTTAMPIFTQVTACGRGGVIRWYERQLDRLYEDAPVRQGDLAQLQQIASTYASRERFLTEMTLDPPEATSDQAGAPMRDDDYLTPSTIHSAKDNLSMLIYLVVATLVLF